MATLLNAKNLTLNEVHHRLGYQRIPTRPIDHHFRLAPLSDPEQRELAQIRQDFEAYLMAGQRQTSAA